MDAFASVACFASGVLFAAITIVAWEIGRSLRAERAEQGERFRLECEGRRQWIAACERLHRREQAKERAAAEAARRALN